MNDSHTHDHSMATHSAKCDAVGCEYTAMVHAHDDEEAVHLLSSDLANHNKEVHNTQTEVEKILEPVKAKMQKIQ